MEQTQTTEKVVKPGWKSTEFWITVLGASQIAFEKSQGSIPEPWGTVAQAIMLAAYTIARAMAKR